AHRERVGGTAGHEEVDVGTGDAGGLVHLEQLDLGVRAHAVGDGVGDPLAVAEHRLVDDQDLHDVLLSGAGEGDGGTEGEGGGAAAAGRSSPAARPPGAPPTSSSSPAAGGRMPSATAWATRSRLPNIDS